jgi:3-deoxy-D-manno-octulosonic-acid transferase
MHNFREIAAMLTEVQGAIEVSDSDTLSVTVTDLIADQSRSRWIGENAYRVYEANRGAVERTMSIVSRPLQSVR